MGGGSREPEGPDDFQCRNCGRWFHRVGLENHEEGCEHPEWAGPIVPLQDVDDHPLLGGPDDELDEADDLEADDDVDDLEDDPGERPDPTPVEQLDPPALATDGGNPAFGAPKANPRADGGSDEDGESEEPKCPECSGRRWFDPSQAAPDTAPAEYDHACPDCSDGNGWVVWNE